MKKYKYTIEDINNPKEIFIIFLKRYGWSYTKYSQMIGKNKDYITQRINKDDRAYIDMSDMYQLRSNINLRFGKEVFEKDLHILLTERKNNLRSGRIFEELTEQLEQAHAENEKLLNELEGLR